MLAQLQLESPKRRREPTLGASKGGKEVPPALRKDEHAIASHSTAKQD
jgi:hypothetical protein